MVARSIISKFLRQHCIYKILITLACIATIVTFTYWSNVEYRLNAKKCFQKNNLLWDIDLLEDIMESNRKPQLGKSIFFHETSCSEGLVKLNARQACAIESAAKTNPTWDVFLLFASPSGFSNNSVGKEPIIAALESYSNIYMRNVNLWSYASETPLNQWIFDEHLFYSKFINSHASDFLRYLSLYKWGGTYLDLDVILKKNLSEIKPNYAGAESSNFVAAGILNFDHSGIGHEIAEFCLREFQKNFDGGDWGNNGPGVITRVLQKLCQTKYPPLMTRTRCHDFNVFPIEAFYAVHWADWRYFFEAQYTNRTMQMTRDSIAVHVWNKHSINHRIRVGSKVAYGLLAAEYCPKVYRSCGDYF